MLKEEDAKKTLDQIIMKFNPRKDALCKLFTDKSIQNKQQKSGNCVVKSGNVAKRFIQIMQELPEQTTVSKQTLANLSTILTTQKLEEIITENKKQSAFGKLLVLEEIAKNGELEKEDEEWFKEVLIARFNKWANNTPPHPYETKLLLNLIIKAENEFGFAFDLQNLSAMHSNVLMDEIVKNNQLTRTYKDWFQTALVERLFAWIKDKDPADREADKAFEALTFLDNHSLVKTYKKKTLLLNSIKNKLNALQQDQEFQNSRKNNKIIKQKYKGFIRIFNKKIAECKLLSRS